MAKQRAIAVVVSARRVGGTRGDRQSQSATEVVRFSALNFNLGAETHVEVYTS
jgi:hypothetical protein